MKKSKMPNEGHGSGGGTSKKGATNSHGFTGLKMEDSQRADVKQRPKHHNPYPKGLA